MPPASTPHSTSQCWVFTLYPLSRYLIRAPQRGRTSSDAPAADGSCFSPTPAPSSHATPAPRLRPLRQHVQQNVRRPDRYRQGRCRTRTSSRFHRRGEPVPPCLLFLAGSWVIRYEALQENGRLLLDASVPLLDVVKSWAPVSGHTSQGLNANYSKRGKVWYGMACK